MFRQMQVFDNHSLSPVTSCWSLPGHRNVALTDQVFLFPSSDLMSSTVKTHLRNLRRNQQVAPSPSILIYFAWQSIRSRRAEWGLGTWGRVGTRVIISLWGNCQIHPEATRLKERPPLPIIPDLRTSHWPAIVPEGWWCVGKTLLYTHTRNRTRQSTFALSSPCLLQMRWPKALTWRWVPHNPSPARNAS